LLTLFFKYDISLSDSSFCLGVKECLIFKYLSFSFSKSFLRRSILIVSSKIVARAFKDKSIDGIYALTVNCLDSSIFIVTSIGVHTSKSYGIFSQFNHKSEINIFLSGLSDSHSKTFIGKALLSVHFINNSDVLNSCILERGNLSFFLKNQCIVLLQFNVSFCFLIATHTL